VGPRQPCRDRRLSVPRGGVDRSGLAVLLQSQHRAHRRVAILCFAQPAAQFVAALRDLRAEAVFPLSTTRADAVRQVRAAMARAA
jgi:hypothetical protein